jgi:hypothetical protein
MQLHLFAVYAKDTRCAVVQSFNHNIMIIQEVREHRPPELQLSVVHLKTVSQ